MLFEDSNRPRVCFFPVVIYSIRLSEPIKAHIAFLHAPQCDHELSY